MTKHDEYFWGPPPPPPPTHVVGSPRPGTDTIMVQGTYRDHASAQLAAERTGLGCYELADRPNWTSKVEPVVGAILATDGNVAYRSAWALHSPFVALPPTMMRI